MGLVLSRDDAATSPSSPATACACASSATAAQVSQKVRNAWEHAEAATAHNTRITVWVAFNYGGRWDIVQACRRAIADGVRGRASSPRTRCRRYMALRYAPDPDLFIRTGGEVRISNFLLWQVRLLRAVLHRLPVARVRRGGTRRGARRSTRAASAASARVQTRRRPVAEPGADAMLQATHHHRAGPAGAAAAGAGRPRRRWPFALLTLVLIGAAGWEWARLNGLPARRDRRLGVVLGAGLRAALWAGWAARVRRDGLVASPRCSGCSAARCALRARRRGWPQAAARAALRRRPGVLLGAAWLALVATRKASGLNFILSIFCLVWAADIFAYFGGRAFGKRKLAPAISPGKSWEGVWGGMLARARAGGVVARRRRVARRDGELYTLLHDRFGMAGLVARRRLPGRAERGRRPGRVAGQAQRRRQGQQRPAARPRRRARPHRRAAARVADRARAGHGSHDAIDIDRPPRSASASSARPARSAPARST